MSKEDYLRLEGMSDEEYKLRKSFYGYTAKPASNTPSTGEDFDADNYFLTLDAYDNVLDLPYLPEGSGTVEWEKSSKFDKDLHSYSLYGLIQEDYH